MGEQKHEHGKMDISVQEETFASFIRWSTNTVIVVAVFLILLYAING